MIARPGNLGLPQAGRTSILSDVGVLAMVPDCWGGPWTTRHHVLSRLARYFNVVWVNPPARWRQAWLGRGVTPEQFEIVQPPPGLVVYEPPRPWADFCRPTALARFAERRRMAGARRTLQALNCRKVILYIWRPDFAMALDEIACDLSCYHVDDEYSFCDEPRPLDPTERRLLERAGQVFIHSPALMERKGGFNPHTQAVPNGVNYAAYATPAKEPQDLCRVARPRIGYVGVLKRHLNLELLAQLAAAHRQYQFVFVGPAPRTGEAAEALRRLWAMPNVHFLGAKSPRELPAYVQHMDVCMLCYRINDYTNCIYPLKLHEYLATGRPVIGTPIRSLEEFADVVRLARTADEWSVAFWEMLSPRACTAQAVQARRRVAAQHEWNVLVERIARVLCGRLGEDYARRFDAACARTPAVAPASTDPAADLAIVGREAAEDAKGLRET
jgi:glycosyltransferase involved in cell wall biosynthesis